MNTEDDTVFVSKFGRNYHLAGCALLGKADVSSLHLKRAMGQYKPCLRCFPEFDVPTVLSRLSVQKADERPPEPRLNEPQPSAPEGPQDGTAKLENWLKVLILSGIVTQVEPQNGVARIPVGTWLGMDLEQKRTLVGFFHLYFVSKGGSGRVSIRTSTNDVEMATFSAWSGVEILK